MQKKDKLNQPHNKKEQPQKPIQSKTWLVIAILVSIFTLLYMKKYNNSIPITERKFTQMMQNNDIKEIILVTNKNFVKITLKKEALSKEPYKTELYKKKITEKQKFHYELKIPSVKIFNENFKELESQLSPEKRIGYTPEEDIDYTGFIVNWGFFIVLILGFWMLTQRMGRGGSGGNSIFNIGKSKAALFDAESQVKITFDNVAGLQEAKEEVQEVVEFLKNPKKFTELGGLIPKGVLLVGPPGTGKTLLAKAVAGEASVPFFLLSGSDFVEMFVGVGAARVRDLFKRAKSKAPCIIFIDEIDSIGRSRGKGQMMGTNDERENTLNSLLVEMDGFTTNSGVIILAATNRPDVLDAALLRPGRFDRQISIDKPDIAEREEIFKVHMKKLKIGRAIDPKKLAAQTAGFAGAEIANVCNESALIAARKHKKSIGMSDFQNAIDRVIGGLEKKNKIIAPHEKKIVAYHEAGHAIAGWFLEHANPLVKVSIIPRGVAALGYAQYLPKEQYLYQTDQLLDEMSMALGGRVAEEIVFEKISTGALNDLERVTQLAYSMITIYGMNEKIGNISFHNAKENNTGFTKPYSESTSQIIDEEVKELVSTIYQRTKKLLLEKKKEIEIIAQELLRKEILFQTDLEKLIGKRPFVVETAYQAFVKRPHFIKHKKKTIPTNHAHHNKKEKSTKKEENIKKSEEISTKNEI